MALATLVVASFSRRAPADAPHTSLWLESFSNGQHALSRDFVYLAALFLPYEQTIPKPMGVDLVQPYNWQLNMFLNPKGSSFLLGKTASKQHFSNTRWILQIWELFGCM